MAKLTCTKCQHSWDEDIPVGKSAVQCPECFAWIPAASAAGRPSAPKVGPSIHEIGTVVAIPADGRDVHEEKTVLAGGPLVPPVGDDATMPSRPSPIAKPAPAEPPPPVPSESSDQQPKQRGGVVRASRPTAPQPAPTSSGRDLMAEVGTVIDPKAPPKPLPDSEGTMPVVPAPPKAPPPMALPSFDHTVASQPATEMPTVMAPSRVPGQSAPPPSAAPPTRANPSAAPSSNFVPGVEDLSAAEANTMPTPVRGAAKPAATSANTNYPQPPMPAAPGAAPGADPLLGRTLGGYRLSKKLGQGGMGAVYLARQVSLDRDIALKILPPKMADNPELMMRFTREALSAAQLTHHNIIQVYDVGSENKLHFISMEFVRGASLRDLVKKEGKLSLDDAAAYCLQAARGLKYAHERGIIHRDIKPDNLMLNEHGVVKIADMGLAKVLRQEQPEKSISALDQADRLVDESADLTLAEVAMGTPAYMPPEQAMDAAKVDHRADQYSLGCTLYYLCAGKTPYSGTTAFDLISKHMSEPLTPLDAVVKNVPAALSKVISRMLEKNPADRYPDLGAVIKDIETYLGISDSGGFTPRENHLAVLEEETRRYHAAPALKLRRFAFPAFAGLMLIAMVASLSAANWFAAGGFLGLLVLTPVFYFALDGALTGAFLFRRLRSVFFGMTVKGWIATIGMTVALILLLYLMKWLFAWLGFAFLAAGIAFGYRLAVTMKLRAQRSESIAKVNELLKEFRLRGASEEAIQDFLCRFGGENWEEFFEEFFGYEAMVFNRGKWASLDKAKPRRKFAVWRDPLARWLDEIEAARKAERERKALEKAEKERLKAAGVSESDAEKQAEDMATKILAEELLPAKAKAAEMAAARGQAQVMNLSLNRYPSPRTLYKGARFLLALLLIVCALHAGRIVSLNIPPFAQGWLSAFAGLGAIGFGKVGAYIALASGVSLFLSVLSRRTILATIVLLGVLLVAFTKPMLGLIAGVPSLPLTEDRLLYIGAVLAILPLARMIYSKLGGGDF